MPNDPELFEIMPNKNSPEALVRGPMSEVTKYIGGSIARIEEEQRLAQAKEDTEATEKHQAEVRACALQILGDGLTHLSNRLDGYETRKAEREEQQRRDEEEAEAAAIEQMLSELPDPETHKRLAMMAN
jgi:hypothetical protein